MSNQLNSQKVVLKVLMLLSKKIQDLCNQLKYFKTQILQNANEIPILNVKWQIKPQLGCYLVYWPF
jgi:hypothetical protein